MIQLRKVEIKLQEVYRSFNQKKWKSNNIIHYSYEY